MILLAVTVALDELGKVSHQQAHIAFTEAQHGLLCTDLDFDGGAVMAAITVAAAFTLREPPDLHV